MDSDTVFLLCLITASIAFAVNFVIHGDTRHDEGRVQGERDLREKLIDLRPADREEEIWRLCEEWGFDDTEVLEYTFRTKIALKSLEEAMRMNGWEVPETAEGV
jgi:hypothetical protein